MAARRRATAADTLVGLTASVTRLVEDGTVERYDIPVETWIVDGPESLRGTAQRDAWRRAEQVAAARSEVKEWKPSHHEADGTPVFVLGDLT